MKVFLDECVDWRLARDIVDHEVKTAHGLADLSVRDRSRSVLTGSRPFLDAHRSPASIE